MLKSHFVFALSAPICLLTNALSLWDGPTAWSSRNGVLLIVVICALLMAFVSSRPKYANRPLPTRGLAVVAPIAVVFLAGSAFMRWAAERGLDNSSGHLWLMLGGNAVALALSLLPLGAVLLRPRSQGSSTG